MPVIKSTEPLERHERIAFQFSGGKDSTVALFLLRDYWPKMTVYWLNSGDVFPETKAFVNAVADFLPNYVEVQGAVNEVIRTYGPPADIIYSGSSEAAYASFTGTTPALQDRALCCIRSKMAPLHARMMEDGITLLVRGQKESDEFKGPYANGDSAAGFEFYYPLEDWTDSDVFKWLSDNDIDIPLYGSGILRSGDCMSCSAWLGDRRAEYLALNHKEAFDVYAARVAATCESASRGIATLFGEMEKLALLKGN